MSEQNTIGTILHSFFLDYLRVQKGLRPSTIKSYRDVLRLFVRFVSQEKSQPIVRLRIADFTFCHVLAFLKSIEEGRANCSRSRNHRLAALNTFFNYLAISIPEMILEAERVASIPTKRSPPAETIFLEPGEISELFAKLPVHGRHAKRDRAILLFLYNTGARVQEAADLRFEHLDLGSQPRVNLHGKGDKWRLCPLWLDTVHSLKQLFESSPTVPGEPVFRSATGRALTRFGLYKIVRRLTDGIELSQVQKFSEQSRHISPHVFRHSTAMHLLEAGVEVNVIRAWLGHVSLDTTNRYAEISVRMKAQALKACEPTCNPSEPNGKKWSDDKKLLDWLGTL